jgi:hypothetical protein
MEAPVIGLFMMNSKRKEKLYGTLTVSTRWKVVEWLAEQSQWLGTKGDDDGYATCDTAVDPKWIMGQVCLIVFFCRRQTMSGDEFRVLEKGTRIHIPCLPWVSLHLNPVIHIVLGISSYTPVNRVVGHFAISLTSCRTIDGGYRTHSEPFLCSDRV